MLKLNFHCHVVCFMKFARQCITHHCERNGDQVADVVESGPKHLLWPLPFEVVLIRSFKAWSRHYGTNHSGRIYRFNKSRASLTSDVLMFLSLHSRWQSPRVSEDSKRIGA